MGCEPLWRPSIGGEGGLMTSLLFGGLDLSLAQLQAPE